MVKMDSLLRKVTICAATLLAGCSSIIKNDTPARVQKNGSDLYPLQMSMGTNGENIISDKSSAKVVIDGKPYKMNKKGAKTFVYDYKRPAKQHVARYYYELDYKVKSHGKEKSKFERSKLYKLEIANRYAIGFETNRGLPGAKIALFGRGFCRKDYVEIGGVACQTHYISPNTLSFVVPSGSECGKLHAKLVSENGDIGLGDFQIDKAELTSDVKSIELSVGEEKQFKVSTGAIAPKGGILVDVTTDIPDSIAMDDIAIKAGQRFGEATIQGMSAATGTLYLNLDGYDELTIPVTVTGESEEEDTDDQSNDNSEEAGSENATEEEEAHFNEENDSLDADNQ